jgi:hypothetical protein
MPVAHLVLADRRAQFGQDRETFLIRVDIYPFTETGNVRFKLRKQHDARDHAVRCQSAAS